MSWPLRMEGQNLTTHEHHLGTGHLLGDLKSRAVSSTVLSMAAQAGRLALTTLSVIVLNRLLLPRDFGLVVMVTSVMGMLSVFKDAGLSIPTVQREDITHAQVSNLFWINVALSGGASLLFVGLAIPLVYFFHEPQLREITMALAGIFLLNGITAQPRAILSRQMRFNVIAAIDVAMVAVGSVVGITMALAGFRHWSIVGQIASTEITSLVLTWSACRWRPGLPKRRAGTWPLVKFGASLAASNFVLALARLSDVVMIGRVIGTDAAGLYSRAAALLIRPLDQILPALHSVFVPALSRLQNDPARYRQAFLRTNDAVALITYPPTALMFGLARPLTRVLFGPGWEGITPIFASLAIAGLFLPSTNVATWVFYSSGRGTDWLKTSVVLSILMVAFLAIGLPFGPTGVALAFSISGVLVLQPVLFYLVGRKGQVTMADLMKGVLRFLPLWVVISSSSYLAATMVGELSSLRQLLVGTPVGLLSGMILAYLTLPLRRTGLELLETLKGFVVRDNTSEIERGSI